MVKKNEELEKRNEAIEEKEARLEKAIKQYALEEPRLAEVLRKGGLLSAAKV
ncbi:MAG: hypothetical protein QME81_19300 [bacterium]|nr:hypothetical protein [bacterium]